MKAAAVGAAGLALGGWPSIAFAGPARLLSLRQEGVTGAPWAASHGLDGDAYQAEFNRLGGEGFRLRRLCGYVVDGVARYASIWDQSPGPAWVGRHGLDAADYRAAFDEYGADGFQPVDISGYSVGGVDYYAAIWERASSPWFAAHGLNGADYRAAFNDYVRQNYKPRSISGFAAADGTDHYAAVWKPPLGAELLDTTGLDNIVRRSFDGSDVPGLSIAIAKDGRLVYAKGFGRIGPDSNERVRPDHRFPIANVSKPITAVAIMTLIEAGQLDLNARVFGGDEGILGDDYGTKPYTRNPRRITVRHRLEHAAGWTSDPMFERTDLSVDEIVTVGLDEYPLVNPPPCGVHTSSNFSYRVLGRVIERVSGQSYEAYVQDNVLAPRGITNMRIAGDTLTDRQADEVFFDATNSVWGDDPYVLPVARMDAHGGWLASATDLVRFAVRVDNLDAVPDILAARSIADMIEPSDVNPSYARGWIIDGDEIWWHNGGLAGTESILVRAEGGFCYAALINGNGLDLYPLVSEMVQSLEVWPVGDPL